MEPQVQGSYQVHKQDAAFQQAQFLIQSHAQSPSLRLQELFRLRTAKHIEEFGKETRFQAQSVVYLDVHEYVGENPQVSLAQLLSSGFDSLFVNPSTGIRVSTSMAPLLKNKSNKQFYILQCAAAVGQPMVVQLEPQQMGEYTREKLPKQFDSYAIITPQAIQVKDSDLVNRQVDFQEYYKLFGLHQILPQNLYIISEDSSALQQNFQQCQICQECRRDNMPRSHYFDQSRRGKALEKAERLELSQPIPQAVTFCRNDNILLCSDCDRLLHPDGNTILAKHDRVSVNQRIKLEKCSIHKEDLRFYDFATKRCYCGLCVGEGKGSMETNARQNLRDVEVLFNEITKELERSSEQDPLIMDLQNCHKILDDSLKNVVNRSKAAEQTLIKYFKDILLTLQKQTQMMKQMIVSQNAELINQETNLRSQHKYLLESAGKVSVNEFLVNHGIYTDMSQKQQAINSKLKECIDKFQAGLQVYSNQQLNVLTQTPEDHQITVATEYNKTLNKRLFGVYGSVPFQELLEVDRQGVVSLDVLNRQSALDQFRNTDMDIAEAQFQVQGMFSAAADQEIYEAALFETAGYKQLKQDHLKQQRQNQKYLETQQKLLPQQLGQTQPFGDQSQMQQSYQQNYQTQSPNNLQLSRDWQDKMDHTQANVTKKHGNAYLESLFEGDDKFDYGMGQLSAANMTAKLNQQAQVRSISPNARPAADLFNQSSLQVKRYQPIQAPNVDVNYQSGVNPFIQQPQMMEQLQQSQMNQQAASVVVPQPTSVAQGSKQQQAVSVINIQDLSDQFDQMMDRFTQFTKYYKLDQKNFDVASQKGFCETRFLIQERAPQLHLITCTFLARARGFANLKLYKPQHRFGAEQGRKFAVLMSVAQGRPCVFVLKLAEEGKDEKREVALFIPSDYNEGTFEGKYNSVLDLTTGKISEGSQIEIDKKQILCGDLCIYKDFDHVEYAGVNYDVEQVDVFVFEIQVQK